MNGSCDVLATIQEYRQLVEPYGASDGRMRLHLTCSLAYPDWKDDWTSMRKDAWNMIMKADVGSCIKPALMICSASVTLPGSSVSCRYAA
jgi:hypothetical protein